MLPFPLGIMLLLKGLFTRRLLNGEIFFSVVFTESSLLPAGIYQAEIDLSNFLLPKR